MGQVPPEVADRLTSEPLTAHLATCRDGRPHVAPVWYLYVDGVVSVATTGRKLADMRENPYVALSVEKATRGRPDWAVTLHGTATVVDDADAFEAVTRQINRKYDAGEGAWQENTLVRIAVGSAALQTY